MPLNLFLKLISMHWELIWKLAYKLKSIEDGILKLLNNGFPWFSTQFYKLTKQEVDKE